MVRMGSVLLKNNTYIKISDNLKVTHTDDTDLSMCAHHSTFPWQHTRM